MKKRLCLLSIGLSVVLAGCSATETIVQPKSTEESEKTVTPTNGEYSAAESDASWSEDQATLITLNQDTAVIAGNGATETNGSVQISAAGTYLITGTLTDGNITVDVSNSDVRLILNETQITSSDAPGINILQGDVIITLADGSENTVTDGTTDASSDSERNNAAIYAKDDLVFNGTGSLTVNGNYKNGIQGKDDLKFVSGNYQITAKNHGIIGKDCVMIADGTYVINADGDGIQASNTEETDQGYVLLDGGTYTITSNEDAIQAESLLQINGGKYTLLTGGGSENAVQQTEPMGHGGGMRPDEQSSDTASQKGLKSNVDLVITGGEFHIDSCDDAIHSNSNMTITGGTLQISAGDDGIHADSALTINDGKVQIDTSYEGLEGYTITLDGGNIQITSTDDGINAAQASAETSGAKPRMGESQGAVLSIKGGVTYVNAGGDGLDANGTIEMSGGTVEVQGPVMGGNGTLDFDEDFIITGGTLLGVGSPEMIQEPASDSTQGYITASTDNNLAVGTTITVLDENGDSLATVTTKKNASWYLLSAPDITSGTTYTVKIDEVSHTVTAQ